MRRALFALCLAMVAAPPAVAAIVDDFESDTPGDLDGQNGWLVSDNHTGGTFDAENTTVLSGLQSGAISGFAGLICEYRHILAASNYCVMTWTAESGLMPGTPGLYVCYGDDWTEAWGVWMNDAGDILVDDVSGYWIYATTVTAGVPHTFKVVQSVTGTFDLYVDGGATPVYSSTVMAWGMGWDGWVDRVLVSHWDVTVDGPNQGVWDDITYMVPPTISVVKTPTGGEGVGAPVRYQIDVTNTSGVAIDELLVVDTISPVVQNVVTTPAGGFAETVTSVAGTGTRYEWSGTGLGLAPAGTLTFIVDGAIGFVCAETAISNTAYAAATAAAGWSDAFSSVAGAVIQPPAATVSVVQTLTPGTPVIGGPVQFQLQVTNTGSATLDSVVVVDTVAPVVTSVVQSTPLGFAASPIVQGASGTIYSWESTGPFYPGDSLTFQLDGIVGDVCASVAASNTGYAFGLGTCGTAEAASNVTGFPVVGPTFSVSTVNTQTGGTGVGEPVQYQVVVTNTGSVQIDDVIIVDTLPAEIVDVTTTEPGGFTPPIVIPVAGGNRYEWAATGVALAPLGTLTFTIDGAVGLVCSSLGLSNTAYAAGWNTCAQTSAFGSAAGSVVDPPVSAVSITETQTPASPLAGDPVQYQIVVTNTGTATIDDVVVTDTVQTQILGPTQTVTPVGFATQPVAGRVFSWINTAPFLPGASVMFQIDGTVGLVCITAQVSNTVYVAGTSACVTDEQSVSSVGFTDPAGCGAGTIDLTFAVSPAAPALCESVTVDLTITNVGATDIAALGLEGGVLRPEGPGQLVSGPTPPLGGTLLAGDSVTCSFVYSVSTTGDLGFSVTVTGTDPGSGLPIPTYLVTTPLITIPPHSPFPAQVTFGGTSGPAQPRCVSGTTIDYTIIVQNQGWDPAAGVIVTDTLPPGLAFVGCGGAPCGLASGSIVVWTMTGTLAGFGDQVSLSLQVTAPGDGTCPPLTVTDSCSLGGCVMAAWTDLCGQLYWPWYSLSLIPVPEIVNATIAATVKPPTTGVAQGATIYYDIVLNNACTDTAINVQIWDTVPLGLALPTPWGGTSTVMIVSWPTITLGPAATVTVYLAAVVTTASPVLDPVVASVAYANSAGRAQPLVMSSGGSVTVMSAALAAVMTGPDQGYTDDYLTFTISIENTGTDVASNLVVTDNLPEELLFHTGTPTPAVAGRTVTWALPDLPPLGRTSVTITTKGTGSEKEMHTRNTAVVTATNSKGLALAPVSAAKTVSLTPKLVVRVYPTPFSPATAVGGTLKFSGIPGSTVVRIYTVSGVLVRQLSNTARYTTAWGETVARHRLEWDGRTDTGTPVAPGLYLYVVELPDGRAVKGNFGVVR